MDEEYIVPGWKVCRSCHDSVKQHLARNENSLEEPMEGGSAEFVGEEVLEKTFHKAEQRDVLNSSS